MENAKDGSCGVASTKGRVGTCKGSDEEPGPAAALVVGPRGSRTAAVICVGGLPTAMWSGSNEEPAPAAALCGRLGESGTAADV